MVSLFRRAHKRWFVSKGARCRWSNVCRDAWHMLSLPLLLFSPCLPLFFFVAQRRGAHARIGVGLLVPDREAGERGGHLRGSAVGRGSCARVITLRTVDRRDTDAAPAAGAGTRTIGRYGTCVFRSVLLCAISVMQWVGNGGYMCVPLKFPIQERYHEAEVALAPRRSP